MATKNFSDFLFEKYFSGAGCTPRTHNRDFWIPKFLKNAIFSPKMTKMSIFGLLRGCSGPKSYQHHENFFAKTFVVFWRGPKIFRPPRAGNTHFRPPKFLQGADFWRKMAFLRRFVEVVHQKLIGTTKIFSAQKHV